MNSRNTRGAALPGSSTTYGKPGGGGRRTVTVRDWLLTLVIALSVAFFIRGFIIEAFRIPTTSMEKTLLAGDFVLVSKLHYGPRLPRTIGIPFTRWQVPGVLLPAIRLPGYSRPTRGDVIVFNFPVDDKPLGEKIHYIKRIVGMPGDTLTIVDKIPFVNDRPVPLPASVQQKWLAVRRPEAAFPIDRLHEQDVEDVGTVGRMLDGVSFQGTVALAQQVARWQEIESIRPLVSSRDDDTGVFPPRSGFSRDNYGPIFVPSRGSVIPLTPEMLAAYRDVIERYDGNHVTERMDGTILIDGKPTEYYVVKQDYFFVMGDNRDSSYDSRLWGFVPWDHVVGKATTIYFSWNLEEKRPRKNRMFSAIQ